MPTLRQRLADALLGDEKRRLQEGVELLLEAQRFTLSPESLIQRLGEVDSRLIDLIIQQQGYTLLGVNGRLVFTETDRLRAVDESRYMAHYDVQTGGAVEMWTNFGFGQRVQIAPRDPEAVQPWSDFWNARANAPVLGQRKLQRLSDDLITDGEYFLVFYASTLDGAVTLRRLRTEQIAQIVTEKDDPDIPLAYVQNRAEGGQVYYPDWQASEEQQARVDLPPGAQWIGDLRQATRVVVLHAALNEINGRGWPQLRRALEWARAYKDFLGDRATVARAVAMFVDKLKVKGGSRAVDDAVARLQSTLATSSVSGERNPPPAPGSTWIENEAATRSRLPLATGAGDAQTDGMTLLGQFAAGSGIPLHWLGRPDAMQNRATARESSRPWYEQIESYQLFWSDVFSDMVEIVLRMKEEYGKAKYQTYDADVTLESPLDTEIAEVVDLLAALGAAVEKSLLPGDVAERVALRLIELALTQFGVRDAAALVTPEEQPDAPEDNTPPAVTTAIENYRAGRVSAVALAEYLTGVFESNGKH